MPQPLPGGAQQGDGIDARMPVEKTILVGQHRFHVTRRNLVQPHRVPPDVPLVRKGAQWRAVSGQHELHPAPLISRRIRRQREKPVGDEQGGEQGGQQPAQASQGERHGSPRWINDASPHR